MNGESGRSQSTKACEAARRPSWDEYFLSIANDVKERSTCLRRQVGAIVVKDKRILSTGYNGAPSGFKHCSEVGCVRAKEDVPSGERHELCRGIHAEQNAIVQAAAFGVSIRDSTIYCTHSPCVLCAKMIINAGIRRVVTARDYPDDLSKSLLREAQIEIKTLP